MCSRSMVVVLRSAVKSCHPKVFCKKGGLRNFAKLTGKYLRQSLFFEVGLSPSKKIVICLIKRPLKMMKNAFYFILKAPFVFKIKVFVTTFWSCQKNGLIKKTRLTSNFSTSQPGSQTIAIHMLPDISQSKGNTTRSWNFTRLNMTRETFEYDKRNIFLQKLCGNWGRETSFRDESKWSAP